MSTVLSFLLAFLLAMVLIGLAVALAVPPLVALAMLPRLHRWTRRPAVATIIAWGLGSALLVLVFGRKWPVVYAFAVLAMPLSAWFVYRFWSSRDRAAAAKLAELVERLRAQCPELAGVFSPRAKDTFWGSVSWDNAAAYQQAFDRAVDTGRLDGIISTWQVDEPTASALAREARAGRLTERLYPALVLTLAYQYVDTPPEVRVRLRRTWVAHMVRRDQVVNAPEVYAAHLWWRYRARC